MFGTYLSNIMGLSCLTAIFKESSVSLEGSNVNVHIDMSCRQMCIKKVHLKVCFPIGKCFFVSFYVDFILPLLSRDFMSMNKVLLLAYCDMSISILGNYC